MKKTILFLCCSLFCLANYSFSANPKSDFLSCEIEYFGKKRVQGTITLSGGCTVDYDVMVEYTIFPPAIQSIHGTVTFSGTCSGTQTFRAGASTDGREITDVEILTPHPNLDEDFRVRFEQDLNNANIF